MTEFENPADHQAPSRSRPSRRGGTQNRVVELVRLLFIAILGTAGFKISLTNGSEISSSKTLLAVFLGAATGYVIGGMFGRFTTHRVSKLEQGLRKTPVAELASGVAGLIVGLVIAFLVSVPLLHLPPTAAWISVSATYVILGAIGVTIGKSRYEEIFAMLGMKPRVAGLGRSEVNVIDTSVLIDGRVADLASTGFLSGTLLIHSGVLQELQTIADSSDPNRRTRGRRGLDVLARLQKDPRVETVLVEEAGVTDVDAALVRLARERSGTLVTADVNLAKVAAAVSVPVRSINALAAAFRAPLAPGEKLTLKLVKEGREHGQSVGYLDDGTMVVVQDSTEFIGNDVTVKVTNLLQTSTGRMVFATMAGAGAGSASGSGAGSGDAES